MEMDGLAASAGWSRPDTGCCWLGGPGTCPDFHCAAGSWLLAAWSPPASCPRSGSGYLVSTHADTVCKEETETGQASGQQWLQALSAAVVQGTDRGVAADLVTADCSTPAAGHMGPLVLGPDAGVSVPSVLGRGLGIGSISVILHNWAPAAGLGWGTQRM